MPSRTHNTEADPSDPADGPRPARAAAGRPARSADGPARAAATEDTPEPKDGREMVDHSAEIPNPDLVDAPRKPEQGGGGNLPPPLFGVLVVAALVVVAAGLRQTAAIIGPLFLVLTIVITVHPLSSWLVRRRVPQWLASVASLLAVYGLIIIVLGSVVWSLTRLGTTLPGYSNQFSQLYQQALDTLADLGISRDTLGEAASGLDLSSFSGVAQSLLSTVTSGLSLLALVAALVFFVVFDAAGFGERIETIRSYRPRIAAGLEEFAEGTRRYWIVTTIFGFVVAALNTIALLIIGVPLAFTWGVLAFVTNYIPNIGFIIGLIPPALIALLALGPPQAIAVLIVYVVINIVVQTMIQPRFTGDAVGISPTVAFLSLIVWAYLLGVLGALLAVPATQFVKALMVDHSTSGQWFGAFLNSSSRKEGQLNLDGVRHESEAAKA